MQGEAERALRCRPKYSPGSTRLRPPAERSSGGNRVRDGENCVALQIRHRDMKGKDALHEPFPLSVRRWRHAPRLGLEHAFLDPRAE
jgi:hypothetical protein